MEGIRFYLPRPFVNVFESFPIRTDIYLANGVVSPDGQYVIITSVTTESGLGQYMAGAERRVEIPAHYIFDRDRVKPESGEVEAAAEVLDLLAEAAEGVPVGAVGEPQPEPLPPPPAPRPTGLNEQTVKNDNAAFAYQPLRGNFDIVYLPDFEEQYVVTGYAGLGNARFEVNLGQGWSLQGFNSLTDNSELNRRIFELIDTAVQAARSAVSGLPALLGLPAPGAGISAIRPQSGEDAMRGGELAASPVTLKIIVVHYCAKGLYPVIKPRELQERMLTRDESFAFLDLFKLLPKVRWSSDYDPTAIERAQAAIEDQTGSFTVPRYPYQYLSFNTFRYMAIELVRPSDKDTSPFEHLYDKTGTVGDVGDARVGEIDELLERIIKLFGRRDRNGQENGQGIGTDDIPPDQVLEQKLARLAGFMLDEGEVTIHGATIRVREARVSEDGILTLTIGAPDRRPTAEITKNALEEEFLAVAKRLAGNVALSPDAVTSVDVLILDVFSGELLPE
jgi:hypothetical protein